MVLPWAEIVWARTGFHHLGDTNQLACPPQKNRPLGHSTTPNEDTLVKLVGIVSCGYESPEPTKDSCRKGGDALRSAVGVSIGAGTVHFIKMGRSGSNRGSGDREVELKGSVVVRVSRHREVFGHIETGYENELDPTSTTLVAGELDPRVVVVRYILIKRGHVGDVFPARMVPCHQCRTTFTGEPIGKRSAGSCGSSDCSGMRGRFKELDAQYRG
jgi:hypothetical protein